MSICVASGRRGTGEFVSWQLADGQIAVAGAPFVSRGDNSGTNQFELLNVTVYLLTPGVGSQFVVTDLNHDGAPDVVTSGPKGTFIFWNQMHPPARKGGK